MSDSFNMLETVKTALGITGTYLDGTIALYIAEVGEYLADAGVPASVIGTQRAAGVTTRGVADLWNYGAGAGALSPYFYERAIQLSISVPETNDDTDMMRGTTPTIELDLDTSLIGCDYHVTIQNGSQQITKNADECQLVNDGKTVNVTLSQAETLGLDALSPVFVQVRYRNGNSTFATNVVRTTVNDILLEDEI